MMQPPSSRLSMLTSTGSDAARCADTMASVPNLGNGNIAHENNVRPTPSLIVTAMDSRKLATTPKPNRPRISQLMRLASRSTKTQMSLPR